MTDGLWMDELAAVQECSPSELALPETSGISLANDFSETNKNIALKFLKDHAASGKIALQSLCTFYLFIIINFFLEMHERWLYEVIGFQSCAK